VAAGTCAILRRLIEASEKPDFEAKFCGCQLALER
jgi:hypothetical protein